MSLKRDIHYPHESAVHRTVVRVNDLIKELELMTGIRKRIRDKYYDRPEILAEIGEQIRQRLKEE